MKLQKYLSWARKLRMASIFTSVSALGVGFWLLALQAAEVSFRARSIPYLAVLLATLVFVVALAGFFVWMFVSLIGFTYRGSQVAVEIEPKAFAGRSVKWAIWSWFIPLYNLGAPYEILKTHIKVAGGLDEKQNLKTLGQFWWPWVAFTLVTNALTRLSSLQDNAWLSAVVSFALYVVWAYGFFSLTKLIKPLASGLEIRVQQIGRQVNAVND
jgi:hypothetical protein